MITTWGGGPCYAIYGVYIINHNYNNETYFILAKIEQTYFFNMFPATKLTEIDQILHEETELPSSPPTGEKVCWNISQCYD